MVKTMHEQLGFVWICPICFYAKRVTASTMLCGLNLRVMDFSLAMWIRNATPKLTGRISANKHGCGLFMSLFRKAYTNYYQKYVQPYLVLPGMVEVDETNISR